MTDTSTTPYLEAMARRREMEMRLASLERTLAAATAAPGWANSVKQRLIDLQDALAAHVAAVEARDGLLAEIVEAAPRLANAADRMRVDHDRLTEHLGSLIESAPGQSPDELREQVVELMRDLVLHRHRGSDLTYDAFGTDIGGQGGG